MVLPPQKLPDGSVNPEWMRARKGLVTGSRAGGILGCSPFTNRDKIMRDMVRQWFDKESDFKGNIATEWGNEHEAEAIAAYEKRTGFTVIEEGLVVHPNIPWLAASPDGLIKQLGVVEIKCPFGLRNEQHPAFKDVSEVPHYYVQMQLEMACTNREWCDFVQWNPYDMRIERVHRDPQYFAKVVEELEAFHKEFTKVISDKDLYQPYLDDECEDRKDAQWAVASNKYLQALTKFEQAKEELEEAKQEVIESTRGNKTKGNGLFVYKRTTKGSVSYSKAIKELVPDADLTPFTSEPKESWVVQRIEE